MKISDGITFEMFLSFIDELYDEVCIWDAEYRLIYINKACYRHYGVEPDQLIGRKLEEFTVKEKLWSPSSLSYVFRERKPMIQHQKTFLGIDVVTISVPMLDENDNVKYVVQCDRDNDGSLFTKLTPIQATDEYENVYNEKIIYKSDLMDEVMKYVKKIARVKAPLLILGETGTGKSLLAKYVHEHSDRRDKPFICVNMASISPNVIESEFFGYKKGSFTGANKEGKKGFFECANGGTLFLDEIGEISYDMQAKFLHVIQEEELIPVGGTEPIPLDVRIICATNCDLNKMVEANKFRQDLYHRLNIFEVTIPPLRKRKEDILLLTSHFLNVFNKKYKKSTTFSKMAIDTLLKYPWKGNVRELSNVIERSVVTAQDSEIKATDLPGNFFSIDNTKYHPKCLFEEMSFEEAVEEYERKLIQSAFEKYGSSRKLASALKISQSKANRLIQRYIEKNTDV